MGFSSCGSRALEHRLCDGGARAYLPCSAWTFLDQGSDLCLLHWQVDSYPPGHQGSPGKKIFKVRFRFWIYCPSQSLRERKNSYKICSKTVSSSYWKWTLSLTIICWFFKKFILKFWNHLALVIRVCDMVSSSPGFCLADPGSWDVILCGCGVREIPERC